VSKRVPMDPPQLAGFRFERLLGSGGYSDVFLYQQEMPRRPVAIKVLLTDRLDQRALGQVGDEANAMAAVSTHPYIVTIFHAELTGAANPFLVMEFYPRPNYSVRARTEQLSVAEVLRTGIQVASAVETAHRVGIIHRDIKPANILTSEYGRPGLTDFGIAGLSDGSTDPAEGLSVPWSPPEVITGDSGGDVHSDVYSLGATVYTLLAGRSPYEVTGGSNKTLDLLERIQRADLPPTGRADVPPALERLLRHAMARRPEDRPASAADLARALQDVEVQQQFPMTALEVRDEGGSPSRSRVASDDEDGTRLKSPTVIQSQQPVSSVPNDAQARVIGSVPYAPHEGATVQRSALVDPSVGQYAAGPSAFAPTSGVPTPPRLPGPEGGPAHLGPYSGSAVGTAASGGPGSEVQGSVLPVAAPAEQAAAGGRGRTNLVRVAWVGLAIVAALVIARLAVGAGDQDPPSSSTPPTSAAVGGENPVRSAPPAPTGVTVSSEATGALTASWRAPEGALPDEVYIVTPHGAGLEDQFDVQPGPGQTSVVVPVGNDCVDVRTVRGGAESETVTNCPGSEGPS